jgi:hypothetical protein
MKESESPSEAQQIEILRRWDEARSLIPMAAYLYITTEKLSMHRLSAHKRMFSPWLWAVIILTSIFSFLITGDMSWEWNWASKITAFCFVLFIGSAWEANSYGKELQFASDQLRRLEANWSSAVVYSNLYELKSFIKDEYLDNHDEGFIKWRNEQRAIIHERIVQEI